MVSRQWATFLVRLLGLLIISLGCWQLAGNLIDSYRDFDPSYLGYFFASQMARPLAGVAVGGLVILASRRLGSLLCRGLDR